MDDEDSIDLEALQAQIDMSMAFAENMVSSWVKPSRKLSSRSNRDIEAELKEYMRRPPRYERGNLNMGYPIDSRFPFRLGVGAAIPESASSSRDVARLKGQLVGKGNKRPREDDLSSREKDGGTDSEGETRGGVIKKKARVDPFTKDGKKKKGHKTTAENSLLKRKSLAQEEAKKELEESVNMVTEGVAPSAASKCQKYKINHQTVEPSHDTPASSASSGVLVNTPPSILLNKQRGTNLLTLLPEAPNCPCLAERPTTRSTERKVVETSAAAISLQLQAQSAALLKFPLLNLTPVDDDSSDQEDKAKSDARDNSPKKKRKRRKKKKIKSDDTSASTALKAPALMS